MITIIKNENKTKSTIMFNTKRVYIFGLDQRNNRVD